MEVPTVIEQDSFQSAWLAASRHLSENNWEAWNLVVQISEPDSFNASFSTNINEFCKTNSLLLPKHICYTIFPFGLYNGAGTRHQLFDRYINNFYRRVQRLLRIQKRYSNWGTYFHRMVSYERDDHTVNQLENIITAINSRTTISRAAYTVVIEKPGTETIKKMGSPCLNYLAIQLERNSPARMGLLAIYRNHDFLERAYGNYWGLCKLLIFLCSETGCELGPVTCISSHAYVSKTRGAFKELLLGL